jgi:hypothetical protein
LDAWHNNRVAHYQPKFEEQLNQGLAARHLDLHFGNHPEAKYTLLLKTTFTKLGVAVPGVWSRPALLSADGIFFETKNPQKQVAVVAFRKVPGGGVDWMVIQEWRVQPCYAFSGKILSLLIAQKIK